MACICNKFWLQTETNAGEFYDPENAYPKNSSGLKVRVMHSGCPDHNGHTNRTQPKNLTAIIARIDAGETLPHYLSADA